MDRSADLRPQLFTMVYEILGSSVAAEDIVAGVGEDLVDGDRLALTTLVTRAALDSLRSRLRASENYTGPWLPEPLLLDDHDPGFDPVLAESISTAMLLILESLQPEDRVVYVLGEVFGVTDAEIGTILCSPEAEVRETARRARAHVAACRPSFEPVDSVRAEAFVEDFLTVAESGNVDDLMSMLTPDAVLTADSDGKAIAVRRPVHGALDVARVLSGFARIGAVVDGYRADASVFNSQPGITVYYEGHLQSALTLRLDGGLIDHVYAMRNPDKLTAADRPRAIAR
ncbi:RNA polymerase subunit sigma-24 [Gordonia terrae]|uniref:RNA polymerase subunit sigma-24 n=1 Tax=Gordonia terrae TaxID=2055 RepID=UPI003F6AC809